MASAATIDEKVGLLSQPAAYGAGVSAVDAIQTHMSWVFLTGRRVYKLKKPIASRYLDFSTVERRRVHCETEVRLNRRLAGDVYVGVVALTREHDGSLALDGHGEPVDWLVVMKQLPATRMLDVVMAAGGISDDDIRRLGAVLAGFYRRSPGEPMTVGEYLERFRVTIDEVAATLCSPRYGLDTAPVAWLRRLQQKFVEDSRQLLVQRVEAGRIVEGHGDLRPEHVCLIEPPVIIDCLEFDRELRLLDPVDELAYLALECERLGQRAIGERVLTDYFCALDDQPPPELVAFYTVFRACLRAQIALWHIDDPAIDDQPKWRRRADAYLGVAAHHAPLLEAS